MFTKSKNLGNELHANTCSRHLTKKVQKWTPTWKSLKTALATWLGGWMHFSFPPLFHHKTLVSSRPISLTATHCFQAARLFWHLKRSSLCPLCSTNLQTSRKNSKHFWIIYFQGEEDNSGLISGIAYRVVSEAEGSWLLKLAEAVRIL